MRRYIYVLITAFLLTVVTFTVSLAADGDFNTALEYYYHGKYGKAVSILENYVKQHPDPASYYLMGYSLYKLGRYREATSYFDEAYLIDPTFAPEKSPDLAPLHEMKPAKPVKKPAAQTGETAGKETKVSEPPATPKAAPAPPAAAKTAAAAKKEEPAKKTMTEAPKAQSPAAPAKPAPAPARQEPTKKAAPETPKPAASAPGSSAPSAPPMEIQKDRQAPLPSTKKKEQFPLLPAVATMAVIMGSLLAGFTLFFLAIIIAVYVFSSLCLFLIAKKLNVAEAWLAWIPIIQIWVIVASARKPWWWLLLLLVPVVSFFVFIYLWMCITENLGRNKWLGLLLLIPVVGIIFIAYLAFSKSETPTPKSEVLPEEDFS